MRVLRIWAAAHLYSFVTLVACISTISISGTKFYYSDGSQFYIKGVAYGASTLVDVLSNTAQCTRDKLGVNTIRVYYVDTTANHDGCMSAFANAGIYVLVALDSAYSAINRASPGWTSSQYNNFTSVMDAFATYNNTFAFVAGNEVINDIDTSSAALYVKAAALDLKKYRDGKGYREIPVGYTGADVNTLAPFLQNYLACGSYAIDFFGQNNYAWCGQSSFTESGYSDEYADASNFNIPIFFSEVGCNTVQPRPFTDQAAILGADMDNLWSGAIVYEWLEEANDYGLVGYASTGVMSGTPTPMPSGGFSNLMSQWGTLTPTGTPSSSYTPNGTPPSCPSSTASGWGINGNAALPTLNKAAVSTRSTSSSTSSSTSPTAAASGKSSTGATKATGSAGAATSDTGTGNLNLNASGSTSTSGGSLSTGAIAGIAVGIVALVITAALVAFLLWRRRRKQRNSPPLDLSPEGLEVGEPPPKPELDSTAIGVPVSQHEAQPELQDASANRTPAGSELHSSPAFTTSTLGRAEMGNSPTPQSATNAVPTSELSTTPATPKPASAQLQPQPQQPISQRPVAPSNSTALKANAPWETDPFPYPQPEVTATQAQKTPLLSETDDDDELKRLEEEERRVDAAIAESERIRALKEEKTALQARKTALLEAKQKASRT
ncbi:uncharacterized protein PAC_06660 [Phialocephala subalpina]|uniref:1,3-beta-glucanosyltransferase n=1 Tax=Phialocephala subalpina TaxID=576137 RepID=A0A1L7WVJ4_9HELO|nr:uncharacterized protein PAC_06660 [Phialocephala subalpina]